MLPNAADLSYFVEVAHSQNLTRASERLGITQPSLTLAIQRLENSIGTQLLIRSQRGVMLTPAGKRLLSQSRLLLQTWEDVKAKATASMDSVEGSYVLGVHPSVAIYSLPLFLPALLEEHPHLEISLFHDLSRKVTEAVIRMEIDLGIVVNPVEHPDLVLKKLGEDEVTLWTARKKTKLQDPHSDHSVLICDPSLLQTQDLQKKLKRAGLRFSRTIHSSNLEVIAKLTAEGCGIGILPARVANANESWLKKLPDAPSFRDEVVLLYRMENKGVKSIQEMAERIDRSFQKHRP